MSKKLLTILLSVVAACAFAFAAACTPVVNPPEEPTEEAQLTLSLSSVQLEKLEEVTLTAKYEDAVVSDVEWKSNDNSIATVTNGLVNAVGEGSTVIVATYEDLEARCLVVVTDNGLVPGITTNVGLGDKLYLINGDDFTIEYEITYNNKVINDAQVTLTLPQNDYADLEGNVLKPKAVGDCGTLTISATWKGLTDTVYVDVSVLPNASAKLVDQPLLTLYNDSRAGATSKALSPKFIVNDVELSQTEYTIKNWEYDQNVVEIDTANNQINAVGKGKTEIVATFESTDGVSVQCVVSVEVILYNDDKTDSITLDTLYLDRQNYYIDVLDVFNDKTDGQLADVNVTYITDVTSGVTYNIPVENNVVKGEDVVKLGLTGERKWQIECGKFSYIVVVPIVDVDPATNLLGKYSPANWDYNVEVLYEGNMVKAVFNNKADGSVKDFGYCEFKPWTNNNYQAGKLVITMNTKSISNLPIIGYYAYAGGCYQMNLALNSDGTTVYPYELYHEDIVAPYEYLVGTYNNTNNWGMKYVLNEDKTVTMTGTSIDYSSNGTYELTPNGPYSGKITITVEEALSNGQNVFEGEYTYSKGTANFNVTLGTSSVKKFAKEGGTDVYTQYAGTYNSGWIPMRFYADGTYIFDYCSWSGGWATLGTYTLNADGTIKIELVRDYNYNDGFEGTYYLEEGSPRIFFDKEGLKALDKDQTYKPIG